MELNWLEDFLALASAGNFSRAAEARHVTQPAFSRRIRALETWIGAPLFNRTTAGVEMTPAGESLRPGAEEIVRRIRHVAQEVREVAGQSTASLKFAATHALSFTFFPGWMRDLELGGVLGPLRLVSDSMQACEDLMLQGNAQFLLCHGHELLQTRFAPASFRALTVGHDALVPFSAPSPAGGPMWSLDAQAESTPYLAYSPESGLGRILEATAFAAFDGPVLEKRMTSHLAATLMSMARDGRGVCWLPNDLAKDDVAAGRLIPASTSARWSIPIQVRLIRPAARQSAAAESFWSLARDRAGA
ncbi:MAG: LysR family transcriptional regulator [Brevundimonas sp.]|nr:MAG: LysR family transcriptional regulator [Brevundimonas sp.]